MDNPDKIFLIIKAYSDRYNAYARTQKEFGYNGIDDITDAFRHAYWNAIMTRDVGYDFAKEIADNHELNRDNLTEKSKEMDLWNNHIGREIGRELSKNGITNDDSYAKETLNTMDKLMHKPSN
ncbi:MAG: hypothetical protein QME32_01850 [Endomicrobiia bacterium]|nr:hypothetical protein [Endomicrobiia bacterium]